MKKSLFLLVSVWFLFVSCNNDNMPSTQDLYGIWEIDHTVSAWVPKGLDGRAAKPDLFFISTLKFNSDGTVRKEVIGEETEMYAVGEFVIEGLSQEAIDFNPELKNVKEVAVSYTETSENFRPSNCSYGTETYYLLPGGKLENREWSYCDGPLEYYIKR